MTEVDHTSPYEKTFLEGLYEKLCNDIADVVIKKITDNSSNMLNTIQYKVRAENTEGQLKPKQIEDLDTHINYAVEEALNDLTQNIRDTAQEAAEEVVKNASFEVSVSV